VPVAVNTLLTADDYAYMLETTAARRRRSSRVRCCPRSPPRSRAGRPRGAQGHRLASGRALHPAEVEPGSLHRRARAARQARGHRRRRPGLLALLLGLHRPPKGTVH
jgi:hypothetical protein